MKVIKNKYVRLITATFSYYYKHKFNCIKSLCNCHSLLPFYLNFIKTPVLIVLLYTTCTSLLILHAYSFFSPTVMPSLHIFHIEHFCRVYSAAQVIFSIFHLLHQCFFFFYFSIFVLIEQ